MQSRNYTGICDFKHQKLCGIQNKRERIFYHALSDIFNKVNFGGIAYEEKEMEQHSYFADIFFLKFFSLSLIN